MSFCLLLTASIDPGNTPGVARKAIKDREGDYYKALLFYLQFGIPIVFCENSGYQSELIDKLCAHNQGKIEFLQFRSKESHRGKSHGEQEIFDHAHQYSKLLKNTDYVIKLTGRLVVKNIGAIINKLAGKSNYLICANLAINLSWCDTRLFIYAPEFYKEYFRPVLEEYLNEGEGVVFEHCLAKAVHLLMVKDTKYFRLLPHFPQFKGINGYNNNLYHQGIRKDIEHELFNKLKNYVFRQKV